MMKKVTYLFVLIIPLLVMGCEKDTIKEHGETVDISKYQERFIHEEWDINTDGSIDKQELSTGVFESLDKNDDGNITNIEWENVDTYYPDNNYIAFNEWDLNNDGRLEEDEFKTRFNDSKVFDRWDTNKNGSIDKNELPDRLQK